MVKSTLQKKNATTFRSQKLYSKRVAKYLLRKLSSATKCVITINDITISIKSMKENILSIGRSITFEDLW